MKAWTGPQLLLLAACAGGGAAGFGQAEPQASGGIHQEQGVWGTEAPGPADVVCADGVLHEDRSGRAQHQLLSLAGADGQGFCGVWRDTRDGNAGLYFGRLDSSGAAREPERPLYSTCSSGREVEPTLALSSDGIGGFAWYSSGTSDQRVNLRLFVPSGELQALETHFGTKGDKLRTGKPSAVPGGGRGAGGHRLPAIAIGPLEGRDARAGLDCALAWAEEGAVWLQRIDARGAAAGPALAMNAAPGPGANLATGAPRLAAASGGSFLCAWPTERGIDARAVGRDGAGAAVGAGSGQPLALLVDPHGGWWLLARSRTGVFLRHLSRDGRPDREDRGPFSTDAEASADVAVYRGGAHDGLVLCVGPAGAAPFLLLLDAQGTPLEREPVPVAEGPAAEDAEGARAFLPGARVATDRASILVAWSEERRGATDVYYRVFDRDLVGGATVRWNGDRASSDQLHPTVATGGGGAVAAWADARSGTQEIYFRRIAADGTKLGRETALPAAFEAQAPERALPAQTAAVRPAVAVCADGSFLVAWTATVEGAPVLRAQAFDAQGEPVGPARALRESAGRCAALALSPERGYAVAFGLPDDGMHVLFLDREARARGPAMRVSSHLKTDNPALALLDSERIAVAWDVAAPQGNKAIRARFLDRAGSPEGGEIEFELMQHGHDWDPTLAAGPEGGFVMAWTAGQAHGRDVFVRFFDSRGRPATEPMAVTTRLNEQDFASLIRLSGGDWAVAWEDDLSRLDHTYVRRVRPPARGGLGPVRTLNEREALFNENRGAPTIAALGDGLIAVWSDVRRSQGHDAYYKVLGEGFDREQ